jgi:predicted ATPase/DNA-binding winged helix-turn-helix (wHTH) protein
MDGRAISFGPFRLFATQRLLVEDDKPVRLGSRAFDILSTLVDRAGEVVGKEELIARAWPQTFVEEANLKIQVSALRRALGDGQGGHRYVVTVPGRGYNFVAPVRREGLSTVSPPPTLAPANHPHNLPVAVTRMIGREETVAALVSRLSNQRLVTIVGPGGMGKTTVALAVAEEMIPAYEHGVWLIDLAPLGDPSLVPSAVATVLGLEVRTEKPLPGLISALRNRRTLLLLDNCEHVIEEAANLAQALLSGARDVSILATSREPLRVAGEREYRLRPLSGPQPSATLTAAEAEIFPAVQLFVERATATVEDFSLTDTNAPLVVEICRRLDGLPLAIEFAASRVEVLGIEALAARLDYGLPLLGAQRRSAIPRHRTMRAVLNWSYALLSGGEQQFFRALGIFTGSFTVEAAAAMAIDAATGMDAANECDAIDRLADLVAKSLVVADVGGARPRFRLLDTIRAYAIEKLDVTGERERRARHHAEYYRGLLEDASSGAGAGNYAACFAADISNIRAALLWAFSDGGDATIAVAMASASAQLWLELSLLAECYNWTSRALARLNAEDKGTRREMVLRAVAGISLRFTTGITEEAHRWLMRALELAEYFKDEDYWLRIVHMLCTYHLWRGDVPAAFAFARRCEVFAAGATDPSARPTAARMLGLVKFHLGDLAGARAHFEMALDNFPPASRRNDLMRFGLDQRLNALSRLSEILWMQGLADQASQLAGTSLAEAQTVGEPYSLCNALACQTSIAIRVGNIEMCARWINELHDQAEKHALNTYTACAVGLEGQLSAERGDATTAVRLLRAALDKSPGAGYPTYSSLYTEFAAGLAVAEAKAGHPDQGFSAIDEALQRIQKNEDLRYLPEALRIKGELLLLQDGAEASAPEAHFRQALDRAHRQGALSWELRAATSLAGLLRDRGRCAEAIEVLRSVYDRFTEGFGTSDLILAKQLLDARSNAGRTEPSAISERTER